MRPVGGDQDAYFRQFDELGEATVRASVASGSWNGGQAEQARIWLHDREAAALKAREALIADFQSSQAATATRAADAAVKAADSAEISATEAREANKLADTANNLALEANLIASNAARRANIAIIAAVISAMASIIVLFVHHSP